MPNRILKESVSTSTNLNRLSLGAEVMFYRLITQADDYGRFDARPPVIRGRCFPLKDDIDNDKVAEWIEELSQAGIVVSYESEGVKYAAFASWDEHQRIRNKRAKFPAPPLDAKAAREHPIPTEEDLEDILTESLASLETFNGEPVSSVSRQVRVKESYLDVVLKTSASTYIFEIKRTRLSKKSATQIWNYLDLVSGFGILLGMGMSPDFPIDECIERGIAVVTYDESTMALTTAHCPDWWEDCDSTLLHVGQRCASLMPESNPIQSESNPNPIQRVGKPTAPKKEKTKSKRAEKSFPPKDYTTVTEAYKTLKGVEPQGDEWKPIQQTIKSMFLDGRTVDQIVGFMQALTDSSLEWTDNWTMKTVRLKLAEWLAGKLDLTERQTGRSGNPDGEQVAEQVALYHTLMSRARSCATEIGLERQRDVLGEEDRQKIAALDHDRVRHLEAADEIKRKLKERGVDVNEKRRA